MTYHLTADLAGRIQDTEMSRSFRKDLNLSDCIFLLEKLISQEVLF